jgi:hypothetical protein
MFSYLYMRKKEASSNICKSYKNDDLLFGKEVMSHQQSLQLLYNVEGDPQ